MILKKRGCSILQGAHQDAKKLTKINLSLNSIFVKNFFSSNKSGIFIFGTSSFKRALGGYLGSLFCKR